LMRHGVDGFSLSSWEPQEEGMMSTAASSSLSKKPRFVSPGKSQMSEGDACKLRDSSEQFIRRLVQALLCERQRGTCTQHNQILCPQLTMRLSISLVCLKQRNERIEWKAIVICEKVNSASKVNR
jgi:hypothetical protein